MYDLAQLARMCVPIDDDINAARLGWGIDDRPARLRMVADAYGLDGPGRRELLAVMDDAIARGGEFVRQRVEAGDPNFIAMWTDMGGAERFDRCRRQAEHRHDFQRPFADASAPYSSGVVKILRTMSGRFSSLTRAAATA